MWSTFQGLLLPPKMSLNVSMSPDHGAAPRLAEDDRARLL
jgi:hypothetical protein